jgi:hypothetical protein
VALRSQAFAWPCPCRGKWQATGPNTGWSPPARVGGSGQLTGPNRTDDNGVGRAVGQMADEDEGSWRPPYAVRGILQSHAETD